MQRRPLFWSVISLLCLALAIYFWHLGDERERAKRAAQVSNLQSEVKTVEQRTAPAVKPDSASGTSTKTAATTSTSTSTNKIAQRLAYRLSNTRQTVDQLTRSDRGILLANALIDTAKPLDLKIPDSLKAPEHNGTYVVQSRGVVNDDFRAQLAQAGATIVSYIPNNAFLVRVSDSGAGALANAQEVQAVLPYEPYYKLDYNLLKLAVEGSPLPDGAQLNLTLFPDAVDATLKALQALGAAQLSQDRSPFGPVVRVQAAPQTLAEIAQLPGVQAVAAARVRKFANDLFRVSLGVSTNTFTNTPNYLGLSGAGIIIDLNDSGVDSTHPDFSNPGNRIFGDQALSFLDTVGHGTHVAGTIAGNGSKSSTVTNASGSIIPGASFRGMATNASLFVVSLESGPTDGYLQEQAALTNALISNNSWNIEEPEYTIEAASYDAAVRDALPTVPGSQPVLFVFSAGNEGNGDNVGQEGEPDSILTPATAKNVITVGAVEQQRFISGSYTNVDQYGNTNITVPYSDETDSTNEVAWFSSRGNVGIGTEGDFGRYKPDVVAPGTFVISCRSKEWATNSYYNPTNVAFAGFFDQTVDNTGLSPNELFIPPNAVEVDILIVSNSQSLYPFSSSDLQLYVSGTDNPTTNPGGYDYTTATIVQTPYGPGLTYTNPPLAPTFGNLLGSTLFFSVGTTSTQAVSFDIYTYILTTNDDPALPLVLEPLNETLSPYYRYESGTSMAAAGVSGMLGLMQEFYQKQYSPGFTPSPALLKALLINGARPVGSTYDYQVHNDINYQGWGMPNLPNSAPQSLLPGNGGPSLAFVEQSVSGALATGQGTVTNINLSPDGQDFPLRVTLTWTDPPGSPVAGVKLVNNLVLVVTNLDTGDVFFGNDIPGGLFNEGWDTNTPAPYDLVNNVQNVYLNPPLGTHYAVGVQALRVNVNAVTGNDNNIVQDYALVISSGDNGDVASAFTLSTAPTSQTSNSALPVLIGVTNGVPILNQRVAANPQFAPTTNGAPAQWNFYIFTNTLVATNGSFTNEAFVTIPQSELGTPRMGTQAVDTGSQGRDPDIDMYVSTDAGLLNTNMAVIQAAINAGWVSRGRGGQETVLLSNAGPNQVYYIGIKSEDQQAAEFGFLAVAVNQPFGQRNPDGSVRVTMLASFPDAIPDGSPSSPGVATIIGVTTLTDPIRRVVVTNDLYHENFGDVIATLTHNKTYTVLDSHSSPTNRATATTVNVNGVNYSPNWEYVYDDSGQGDIPNSTKSDGPGNLNNFALPPNNTASDGVWIMRVVDDATSHTGTVYNVGIRIDPDVLNNTRVNIGPHSSIYFFAQVPPQATNMVISITNNSNQELIYVRRNAFPFPFYPPTLPTVFDEDALISPPGGVLDINKFSDPPLNAGTYVIQIINDNNSTDTFLFNVEIDLDIAPVAKSRFAAFPEMPIPDDAVSYSTNHVGTSAGVVSVDVGVRLDHPRLSDLVLTLVAPNGDRAMLIENRPTGGTNATALGAGYNVTNTQANFSGGGALASTNVVNTSTNFGTLLVNYNFTDGPDDLQVYYDGFLINDTGPAMGIGQFSVAFGPGGSTSLVLVMNNGGNANGNSSWSYTATVLSQGATYATFTEDTNVTMVPIKFAAPPFAPRGTPGSVVISGFEPPTLTGDYFFPSLVDNWSMVDLVTNDANEKVTVESGGLAYTGTNFLDLRDAGITRVLPTIGGDNYSLTFAYNRHPGLEPVAWWPLDGDSIDVESKNFGTIVGAPNTSSPGEVGGAFNFGTSDYIDVPNAPQLNPVNAITVDAWINVGPFANPTGTPIIAKDGLGTIQTNGYKLELLGTANTGFGVQFFVDIPGFGLIHSAAARLGLGWNYVVGRFDGQYIDAFANGIQAVPLTQLPRATNMIPSFNHLQIAHDPANPLAYFDGSIDEPGIYNFALTTPQILDIYNSGPLGRCGTLTPPTNKCTAVQASVSLNNGAPIIITATNGWQTKTIPFPAAIDNEPLSVVFTNNPSGMMLDTFILNHLSSGGFYLPEGSLDSFVTENPQGDWKLEILDNRVGPSNATNAPMLLSWQLDFVFETALPSATPLFHAVSDSNVVPPNSIRYYTVDVPPWASFATNTLFNVSGGGPLKLIFNQNFSPPGTNGPGDVTLLTGAGATTLVTNGTPPLMPNQRYFLGVQNTSATAASFSIEVDFNIITLTNAIAFTNSILPYPEYYQFDVSTNATGVTFETLNPGGNITIVARKGAPLPNLASHDYQSSLPGTSPQSIVVVTNSSPVPLSPGRWYIGAFDTDTNTVPLNYAIRATELGQPTIIILTNNVPFTYQSVPGASQNYFYLFNITQTNSAALFELYNLSGNVDLRLNLNTPPVSPPFFAGSSNPGTNVEEIVIRTNQLGMPINGAWYLGVPNNDPSNVTYTIRAVVSTNGILTDGRPFNLGFQTPTNGHAIVSWPAVLTEEYVVQVTFDFTNWTDIATNTATSTTTVFVDPQPVSSFPYLFYRILQIPVPGD